MRTTTRDGTRERAVLTAMITDGAVLGRVVPRWDGHLFDSRWSNLIAGWCVDHYRSYQQSPGKTIQTIFASWAEESKDEETSSLVEGFLQSLSEEYESEEHPSSQVLADMAGAYFNKVRLSRLKDQLEGDLERGDTEGAEARVHSHRRLDMGRGCRVDLLNDEEAILSTFEQSASQPLVRYPGDLGIFWQGALERDALVAFVAPEKRGKSMWLLDVAWHTILQRKRVAYFEAGDLSERQVKQRFLVRASRHPNRSPTGDWPCSVQVPTGIRRSTGEDRAAEVEYEERTFSRALDGPGAARKVERVVQSRVKSNSSYLTLAAFPTGSLSVPMIRSLLEEWRDQDGWIADCVIIDYADLLAPIDPKRDMRHQISQTWAMLRALSQETHSLVLTATQADTESYNKYLLDMGNFSESKTKNAYVTAMVGINQWGQEKDRGITRLKFVAYRDGDIGRQVHVAGCPALCSPALCSTF